MAKRTVTAMEYGQLLKVLSAAARALHQLGLPVGKLEPESIRASARRSTGLSDWGSEAFIEPMDRLLDDADHAPLTGFARAILRASCVRAVQNRLYIQDHLRRHPAVAQVPVRRPIFVLGFPRTGTTLLQNLLALPSDRRALEFWELTRPVPVHDDPEVDRRRRLRSAERILQAAYWVAPEMVHVHEIRATTPEECWPLFFNSFTVLNHDLQSGLREFGRWLLHHDMERSYQEFRTQLQILLHRRPAEHVVLKCPEHLWFLDALLEVFPDACIVWTHRDPVSSVASYCSLMSLQWRTLYGRIEPLKIGAHIQERFLEGVSRAMASRDAHGDGSRFYDVSFRDLVRDPVSTVRAIHDHFDLASPPDLDAAVQAWLASNRRADQRGAHKYTPSTYGLDAAEIHRQYRTYVERFGIELKDWSAAA